MDDFYELNESKYINWEEAYENANPINKMIDMLIGRYEDVTAYCAKSDIELYAPVRAYLSSIFKTEDAMYSFDVFDEPPKVDEAELKRYHELYYEHSVSEVCEMERNGQLSL